MTNKGISRLAAAIDGRIRNNREANSDLVLDTGTIQNDMSLMTDSYPVAVPQGEYYASQHLTLGDTDEKLTETAEDVEVKIPDKLRYLKPGDRVLVAWVHNDAFVLDRFSPGTDAG